LDAENGTELWTHQFSTTVYSDPIVYEGKTYIGEDLKCRLYCFNAENGSVIWNKYIGGEIYGPAAVDDKIYSKGGGLLWCLNATTGEKIWSNSINSHPRSSPSVADGRVYFCGNDTRCYDADTGEVLWYKPSGDCHFIPVCQESIYIGYKSNRSIACLDAFDGSLQWEYQFESGRMVSASAVAYNKLYVISMKTEHFMYPRLHCFEGPSRPPTVPTINGPTSGKVGTSHNYIFKSFDPEGEDVYYYIRWGDGHTEVWDGPHVSGEDVTIAHTYTRQGSFIIEAKAKDVMGEESDWGELQVTISRDKAINYQMFLLRLLERFPLLQQLMDVWRSFVE
jgi:outer membrane protein assembly factor BamB